MLLIEAPTQMQERMSIPQQHLDVCQAAGVLTTGNAAGNSENFLDLAGQNSQQSFLPNGFTARGIVALVFSVICALLGVVSIVVYGLSDLKFHNKENPEVAMVIENLPKGAAETTVVNDYKD